MYSDDEILAFLDGNLAPDAALAIDTAMRENADLRDRIHSIQIDKDNIRTAFDPLLGVAATRNLEQKLACAVDHEKANRSSAPAFYTALSYATAIAAAVAITVLVSKPKPDWKTEVAHYQALYVADTLSPIAPDIARISHEFERAGEVLGLELDLADLNNVEGLVLRRAQILGYENNALVQIAYTDATGAPVAFCILRYAGEPHAPLDPQTLVGLASVSWGTATHQFLAIGGTDGAVIMNIATEIRSKI